MGGIQILSIFTLLAIRCSSGEETIQLNIGMMELEPFCMKDPTGGWRGFLVDLVDELFRRVNESGPQRVNSTKYWMDSKEEAVEMVKVNKVMHDLWRNYDLVLWPVVDRSIWNGAAVLSQPYLLTPFVPLAGKRVLGDKSTSVLDKMRNGEVKAAYVGSSSMEDLLLSDTRSPAKDLRALMIGEGNEIKVPHYHGGVELVRAQSDHLVFYGEELRLKRYMLQAYACDLVIDYESVVGIGAYTLPFSRTIQAKSQTLMGVINSNLLKMRQDGTIERMKAVWWPQNSDSPCYQRPSEIDVMSTLENYY